MAARLLRPLARPPSHPSSPCPPDAVFKHTPGLSRALLAHLATGDVPFPPGAVARGMQPNRLSHRMARAGWGRFGWRLQAPANIARTSPHRTPPRRLTRPPPPRRAALPQAQWVKLLSQGLAMEADPAHRGTYEQHGRLQGAVGEVLTASQVRVGG